MKPPYFVAEIGANHDRCYATAKELIEQAAWAGANAVKFQTFKVEDLAKDPDYVIKEGLWTGMRLEDLYTKAQLPWEWHKPLFEHAKRCGVTPFSTPFSLKALEFLESIDCPMYKISSFQCKDKNFLQEVADTGKDLVVSVGMTTDTELKEIIELLDSIRCVGDDDPSKWQQITVLHCVSAYPARPEQMNLTRIAGLIRDYEHTGLKFGLSDHTKGITIPIVATALGASMIEKHFMHDDGIGLDKDFSLSKTDFWRMVRECKDAASSIGIETPGPASGERLSLELQEIRNGT